MENKNLKIYVTGHRGLVGSAVVKTLKANGYDNIVYKSHAELDLTKDNLDNAFSGCDVIIHCAGKVGGIGGNSKSNAEYLYENNMMAMNVINTAFRLKIPRLVFLGSSCIYPKFAQQPIKEDSLLSDKLEPTNEGYALAKITGIKYCQFIRRKYGLCYYSLMPCNLYGPNDRYDLENGHVLPTLIMKFHLAKMHNLKQVELWGDGTPRREFLYSEDLADAVVKTLAMNNPPDIMNIGSGQEITIRQLAGIIKNIVGYDGNIVWNDTIPNGTPRKLIDSTLLKNSTNWFPKTSLTKGIELAYKDFLNTF